MQKKYQVFVSSTYQDLIEERDEVMKALLELDCIPAGMELFPSADDEAFEYIKKVIDNCDYFLLIIGGRYGSLHNSGKSYTQLEYEYAISKKIPTLAFLRSNIEELPSKKYELDNSKREKLQEFKTLIQKKLVRYWSTTGELSSIASRSMVRLMKDKPREGWTRFSQNEKTRNLEIRKIKNTHSKIEKYSNLHVEEKSSERIKLKIIALQHSVIVENNYDIVFGNNIDDRRLRIVVGRLEGHGISLAMAKLSPKPSLTHGLLFDAISKMGYKVIETSIIEINQDDVFICKMVLYNEHNYIELTSRVSDMIPLAVMSNAPLFCDKLLFDVYANFSNEEK